VKHSIAFVSTLALITATSAFAATDSTEMSSNSEASANRTYVADEMVGIKPAVGFVTYSDAIGNNATRMSYGITGEFNLSSLAGMDFTRYFVGPETGFVFSHLGNPGSDGVGSSADQNYGSAGANMFMIPVNLKVAYAPIRWVRLGAHGGGNVVYRSIANSMKLGSPAEDGTDSAWRMYPNIGADLDFSVTRNVALSFRPDWTITNDTSMFSGLFTLGVTL
jgi:hypothetical protein